MSELNLSDIETQIHVDKIRTLESKLRVAVEVLEELAEIESDCMLTHDGTICCLKESFLEDGAKEALAKIDAIGKEK